jgi:uncharacterized repeat protein (TIGR01451 family)
LHQGASTLRHTSLRIPLIFILSLGLMSLHITPFGEMVTAIAQAQIVVDFDTFLPVPAELRQPIFDSVLNNRSNLHESGQFAISSLRVRDGWADAALAAQYIVDAGWNDINWDDVVHLVGMRDAPGSWTFYLEASPAFAPIKPLVPVDFIDYRMPDTSISETMTFSTNFLFPWTTGQSWRMSQDWHSGNALDFAPGTTSNLPVNGAILAAQWGTTQLQCYDGAQNIVSINTPNVGTTQYVHLDQNSVADSVIGRVVPQGMYIGHIYNGTAWYNESNACLNLPAATRAQLRFSTPCGCGTGAHLHWVLPNRSITIQGASADSLNWDTWYNSDNNRINTPYAPGIPTITSPANNSTVSTLNVPIVIQAGAINGIGWGSDWHLQVDDSSAFNAPLTYDQTIATTTPTVPVPSAGNYCARVSQGDTIAYNSDWSTTICFTVSLNTDVGISQQANPNPPAAGQNLTYTITVNNVGPTSANNVRVTDTLPAGTTFVSATPASCTVNSLVVSCSPVTMNSGSSLTVTLVVATNPDSTAELVNTATVASDNDSTSNNNSNTLRLTPVRVADTAITQTHQPEPVKSGQNVTLTLNVTNRGVSTAANITVQDTLPAGLNFVSADYQGCSHASGVVTCPISTLAPNASVQIGITAAAGLGTVGTVTNTTTVTGNSDPVPADNTSSHNITVVERTSCEKADVNQSGNVNIVDLQLVATLFNVPSSNPGYVLRRDINLDGVINIIDLQRVAMQFGNTCAP